MPATDAVIRSPAANVDTQQVRKPKWSARDLRRLAGAVVEASNLSRTTHPLSVTSAATFAHCQMHSKAAEVQRQMTRLKWAKEMADPREDSAEAIESVAYSCTILQNLISGPIPVPVASWSPETGSSLFFDQENFYGDIEIGGNTVDYLLKWTDEAGEQEIYDSEKIEGGRIPPRLLAHLFAKFARQHAEVL